MKMKKLTSSLLALGIITTTVPINTSHAASSIVDSYRTQSAYKKEAGYQDAIKKSERISNDRIPVTKIDDPKNSTLSGIGTLRIKNDQNNRYGTAFVIDKHTIITNNHVVRDKHQPDIYKHIDPKDMQFRPSRDGNHIPYRFSIKDVKMLKNVDIAVLHTNADLTKYVKPLSLASESSIKNLRQYTSIYGVGYPDVAKYFKDTNFKPYEMLQYKGYYLQPTYSITPQFYTKMIIRKGSSGSPIMNSQQQVIGVNSSGFNNRGEFYYDGSFSEMAYVQSMTGKTREDVLKLKY